jgi:uncharacterized protein
LGVISEISAHAQELSRESAVSYSADVTTNAWLLSKERARRMLDVGVTEYQVSLDGERQEHDATRVRRNGAGSFDAIWANLSDLRETDWSFLVTLRLHLTPSNIASMIRLSRDLGRAFLGDPRFRLLLKPIERLGGPNDAHMAVLGLDSETAMGVVREAILADQPAARFAEPDAVCYAAKATSLVVRADGRIGKCTVALQDPTNTVGDLLPDGRLIIDQDRLRPWLRGWGSVDPEELACPLEGLLSSLGRPETAIRPELPVLQASS